MKTTLLAIIIAVGLSAALIGLWAAAWYTGAREQVWFPITLGIIQFIWLVAYIRGILNTQAKAREDAHETLRSPAD